MKYIKRMVDEINDEIHSAKKYAERALEYRAKGEPNSQNSSQKFKAFANQELEHAMYLHELAVKEIERLKNIYVPPQDMLDKWEESHINYVEKVAWIKKMLDL